MGAESSSPAMEGAKRGQRPCTPPSAARLMKDAPDVKLIVEPQPTPPADESRRVDRAPSLRLLCDEMKCHEIKHSSRHFIDHLLRVSFILEDWGCSEQASLCGLFHSVYGTASFQHSTLAWSERDKLRAVIGEAAEELVYMFCTTSAAEVWTAVKSSAKEQARGSFELGDSHTKGTQRVSARQLAQLAEVKLANQAEQGIKVKAIRAKVAALEKVAGRGAIKIRPEALDAMRMLLSSGAVGAQAQQPKLPAESVADSPVEQASKTDEEEEEEEAQSARDAEDACLLGITPLPSPGQLSVFGVQEEPS